MGRSPCCDKVGLKKGPWTPEEDQKLLAYIEEHGHGSWRALPAKAGLQRCGKSCRLRWTNYLRPDIKRGKFSLQEEQTIIQLHALLGNRWSAIATHLPKRTDNEIKNYWNTHLKKRLAKMGIDPVTHKPKNDALLSSDGQSKNAANLSHMAQWESARLEAEARLVRQSKLRTSSSAASLHTHLPHHSPEFGSPPPPSSPLTKPLVPPPTPAAATAASGPPRCLDILKAWNGVWSNKQSNVEGGSAATVQGIGCDLESPTSTLSYSENVTQISNAHGNTNGGEHSSTAFIEFVGNNSAGSCDQDGILKEENEEDWKGFGSSIIGHLSDHQYKVGIENSIPFSSGLQDLALETGAWTTAESIGANNEHVPSGSFVETFTDLLLSTSGDRRFAGRGGDSENGSDANDDYEDNKNYWNSILNLVNSSPSDDSPIF